MKQISAHIGLIKFYRLKQDRYWQIVNQQKKLQKNKRSERDLARMKDRQ